MIIDPTHPGLPIALRRIRGLVGAPFRSDGTSFEEGFDCLTFCWEAYRILREETGSQAFRFPVIPQRNAPCMITAEELERWRELWRPCTPSIGAVAELQGAGRIHMGVLIDRGMIIHCRESAGVVMHHRDRLRQSIRGWWRSAA